MTLFADTYGWPDIAAIKADGFGGLIRYASHTVDKCVTAAEAAAERAAGLELLLVFEDAATNALGGYDQGVTDARFANAVADGIGYPAGCPIFYTVDFPAGGWQLSVVDAYFQGILSVRGRPSGPYGSITVVNAVIDAGLAVYAWQTLAWSNGLISNRAVIYQSQIWPGLDVDEQLGFVPAWGAPGQAAPPPPKGIFVAQLNAPIIAIINRPQNDGYWMVGQDGGIFPFGAASAFNPHADLPALLAAGHLVRGGYASPSGNGLVLVGSDGGTFGFGDAVTWGNIPGLKVAPSTEPIEA